MFHIFVDSKSKVTIRRLTAWFVLVQRFALLNCKAHYRVDPILRMTALGITRLACFRKCELQGLNQLVVRII